MVMGLYIWCLWDFFDKEFMIKEKNTKKCFFSVACISDSIHKNSYLDA
jgi:hypothetical protein